MTSEYVGEGLLRLLAGSALRIPLFTGGSGTDLARGSSEVVRACGWSQYGGLVDPTSMVAAARSTLAGLVGISPSARQRAEIRRDVQLFKTLKDQQLDAASAKLELLVNLEVDRLYDRKVKSFGRSFAWSTLFAGSIVAIAPGVGAWLLYPPHGAIEIAAFVVITVIGGVWVAGTIGVFFTARPDRKESDAGTRQEGTSSS